MLRIYHAWHPVILDACRNTSIPESFLAALTANESGGDPTAHRLEGGVFDLLWAVWTEKSDHYFRITRNELEKRIARETGKDLTVVYNWGEDSQDAQDVIKKLATSWGLTQIMGYQVMGTNNLISALINPLTHYTIAVGLIRNFAKEWKLDPKVDHEKLFRCWNSGHPNGETFDRNYVSNGLERMKLYEEVSNNEH